MLPWTELTGRQVMRIDWSAPREVVNSSLGETSFNSDWGGGGGGGGGGDDGELREQ